MSINYDNVVNNPFENLLPFMDTFKELLEPHINETCKEKKINRELNKQIIRIVKHYKMLLEEQEDKIKFKNNEVENRTTGIVKDMHDLCFQISCKFIDNITRDYKSYQMPVCHKHIYDRIESINRFYSKDYIFDVLVEKHKVNMNNPNKLFVVPMQENSAKNTSLYTYHVSPTIKTIIDTIIPNNRVINVEGLGIPILLEHNTTKQRYYLFIEYVFTYNTPTALSNFHLIIMMLILRNTKLAVNRVHQIILNRYFDRLQKENINIFTQMFLFKVVPQQNCIIQENLYSTPTYYNVVTLSAVDITTEIKKNILTDDDLIDLLSEKIEPSKKKKNKTKKNKSISPLHIEPTETINCSISKETEQSKDIEQLEETEETEEQEEIEENKLIVFNKYETILPFKTSFNRNIYFAKHDIDYINYLLKDLYENNSKFQLFIDDNEYNYVKVIKNIHHDINRRDCSLHFNTQFCSLSNMTKTPTFHLYVNEDKIVAITKIENIL
jgi:hypothetical protein